MRFYKTINDYVIRHIQVTLGIDPYTEPHEDLNARPMGKVYRVIQFIRDRKNVLNVLGVGTGDSRPIRAWMLTRGNVTPIDGGGSIYTRDHYFTLTPYYGVKSEDESELMFQDHIDQVINLFEGDYTLGGNALKSTPWQVQNVHYRQFSNVLCHSADIIFRATEPRRYT